MPSLDHLRRSDTGRKAAVVLAALTCMAALFVLAARAKDEGTEKRNIYIPATISPEAQQILKNLSKEKIYEDTVLVKLKLVYNLDRTFCRISGSQK